MRRSKRPGRSSAESRMSGRLVAAMMITPSLASKPSISTSSWFRVCSRSSCPPPTARAALAAHSVDLVDEDQAGGVLLAFVKQVPHARGADADEKLDEIGSRDGEEGDVGLAGDGLGQQGFSRARRADEQDALGDFAAQALELLGLLEELDDLLQLVLGLLDAGDVLEGELVAVAGEQAGLALAEGEGLVAALLAHDHHPEDDEDDEGGPGEEDAQPLVLVQLLHVDVDLVLAQAVDQIGIIDGNGGLVARVGAAVLQVHVAADHVAGDAGAGDLVVLHLVHELGEGQGLGLAAGDGAQHVPEHDEDDHRDDPE